MIYDTNDFSLVQPGNCLAQFIVVHKDDFFAPGTDQMTRSFSAAIERLSSSSRTG